MSVWLSGMGKRTQSQTGQQETGPASRRIHFLRVQSREEGLAFLQPGLQSEHLLEQFSKIHGIKVLVRQNRVATG